MPHAKPESQAGANYQEKDAGIEETAKAALVCLLCTVGPGIGLRHEWLDPQASWRGAMLPAPMRGGKGYALPVSTTVLASGQRKLAGVTQEADVNGRSFTGQLTLAARHALARHALARHALARRA